MLWKLGRVHEMGNQYQAALSSMTIDPGQVKSLIVMNDRGPKLCLAGQPLRQHNPGLCFE